MRIENQLLFALMREKYAVIPGVHCLSIVGQPKVELNGYLDDTHDVLEVLSKVTSYLLSSRYSSPTCVTMQMNGENTIHILITTTLQFAFAFSYRPLGVVQHES